MTALSPATRDKIFGYLAGSLIVGVVLLAFFGLLWLAGFLFNWAYPYATTWINESLTKFSSDADKTQAFIVRWFPLIAVILGVWLVACLTKAASDISKLREAVEKIANDRSSIT
jgi:hypothetical protein